MALITVEEAVAHLRLPSDYVSSPPDQDLALKMQLAEDIVLDYLKTDGGSPGSWDEETVPGTIKAAILLQLGELWRFRGDDEQSHAGDRGPGQADGYLSRAVTRLLHRWRDPTLA